MFKKAKTLGNLIKVSHSIFALPFAIIMIAAVAKSHSVTAIQVGLIVFCVLTARSAAMAFNRVVDADIDQYNPRTAEREIPSGKVSRCEGWIFVLLSAFFFISGSFALGWRCGLMSAPVLLVLLGYSFVKRFSNLSHLVLGLSLGLAPGAVWYALTLTWSWQPVSLMASVLFWVAGFDMLYACQDMEFDRKLGLYSVPSALGLKHTRFLAILFHIMALICLAIFGSIFQMGAAYWFGSAVFGIIIGSQHYTVYSRGISAINHVFFTRNGLASIMLLIFVLIDLTLL